MQNIAIGLVRHHGSHLAELRVADLTLTQVTYAVCIVFFSFKTNCFFAKTRDGFEGVQRRGPVKGAVRSRSSKTLDREHRWNNAGFERRGLSGEKNGKKNVFG